MVALRVSVRSSQEPKCAQWVTLHTGGFEKANGEENKTHVRCEPELLHTCLAHASPWAMESPKQNGKGSGDDRSKLSLRNQLYNVCVLTEWCSWRGVWQVLQHVALCTPSICLCLTKRHVVNATGTHLDCV